MVDGNSTSCVLVPPVCSLTAVNTVSPVNASNLSAYLPCNWFLNWILTTEPSTGFGAIVNEGNMFPVKTFTTGEYFISPFKPRLLIL